MTLIARAAWRGTDAATAVVQRWAAVAAVAVLTAERRRYDRGEVDYLLLALGVVIATAVILVALAVTAK